MTLNYCVITTECALNILQKIKNGQYMFWNG